MPAHLTQASAPRGQTEKQSAPARGKNGGARPGAGRKKGVPNKATLERQKRIAESGVTPLQVMIDNMRWAHSGAAKLFARLSRLKKIDGDAILLFRELEKMRAVSQECAKDAAPYVHPRIQSIMFGQDPDREAIQVEHRVDNDTIERMAAFLMGEEPRTKKKKAA